MAELVWKDDLVAIDNLIDTQAHGGRIVASNLPTGAALFTVQLPPTT